jgi:flavin-dependent dehydrogenase
MSELPTIAVGGGLAGAAFALELARNGRPVIVLERAPAPQHKVCGEFLSAEAQTLLQVLGLDLESLHAVPMSHACLVSEPYQAIFQLPFVAAAVSRFRLDQALLLAAQRAGANVVRGTAVLGIEPHPHAVLVKTHAKTWTASAIALATGKHSLRSFRRPLGRMVGFKMHLESTAANRQLANQVQLVFFRAGYMGACVVEAGTLSIAWVMTDELLRNVGSTWPAQRDYLARQSERIGDLLSGARPMFAKPAATASIPYGYLRKEAIDPRIFPIGDQLAVVPSFIGDGMAIALHTGLTAARSVLAGEAAASYHRKVIRLLQRQFGLARILGGLLETRIVSPTIIAAATYLPSLATRVVAATRLHGFDANAQEL